MTKEQIRNVIELFISWNDENMPIDVANLDSAVDYIISCQKPVDEKKLNELAESYANHFNMSDGFFKYAAKEDFIEASKKDFKAGYRKAKEE